MDAFPYARRINPSRRAVLLRLVVDRNPFYLFSAVCMLVGCYVLSHDLGLHPTESQKQLILLGVVNVYEVMLIGLALYLITRRRLFRDGKILLLIESLFLVDVTFLGNELVTTGSRAATVAVLLLLTLGAAKVLAIVKTLRLANAEKVFTVYVLSAAAMLAMPGLFGEAARHHSGALPATVIYAAWWVAGLLPVLGTLLPPGRRPKGIESFTSDVHRVVGSAYMVLPYVSLLAHLALANWVYQVHFYSANAAPVLLGLAVAIGRSRISLPANVRSQLHGVLGFAAVIVSASFPSLLVIPLGPSHALDLSPFRLALLGAAIVYADGFVLYRQLAFLCWAALFVVSAALGPSIQDIAANLAGMSNRGQSWMKSLIPETPAQWGITAVVASFAFLGLGAAVSLRKDSSDEAPLPPAAPLDIGPRRIEVR